VHYYIHARICVVVLCGPHTLTDKVKGDFCDGDLFKNHPLFSVDKTALQIVAYYDLIEVVNPLGSRTHTLGKLPKTT